MNSTRIRRRAVVATTDGDWSSDVPPLLRAVHAARGSTHWRMAFPRLSDLPSPDALRDIDRAVALLRHAIVTEQRIVVTSDFDCDGATACAVALRGLRMLGARQVAHAVPHRITHGYGLTPEFVESIAPLQPEVIVTVDHGIACHAGIDAAKARGWTVIVTDHHLPGETLPNADAIVNPNRHDDAFPAKTLAGVGVLFYLLLALRKALRDDGDARAQSADLTTLLDLVAVGTVADLVPLEAVNRALVSAGLRRLRSGQGNVGLRALIDVAGRDSTRLTSTDIGFVIAPRINAAGRLDDMTVGIRCLVTDDAGEAADLAAQLQAINAARRDVQAAMVADAERMAAIALDDSEAAAFCVFDVSWHPGVIGLVASKLVERRHRPVIAFAPADDGSEVLRGSARSIPGFHLRDAIAAVDARHPGLITRFGGHAMAAGLTLPAMHRDAFEAAFLHVVQAMLDPARLAREVWSDGSLAADCIDLTHALALRDGGAWGQGYPEPVFDDVFTMRDPRCVGGTHLAMQLERDGQRWRAIHFGGWEEGILPGDVRVAYRPTPDEWRGGDAVQLIVVHREAA